MFLIKSINKHITKREEITKIYKNNNNFKILIYLQPFIYIHTPWNKTATKNLNIYNPSTTEKETIGMEDIKKEKDKDFNGFKAILA